MRALDDFLADQPTVAAPAAPASASPLDAFIATQPQAQAAAPSGGVSETVGPDGVPNYTMSGQPPQSQQQAGTPTPLVLGKPNILTSIGAGLGHGVGDVALGAQQLLGHGAQAAGLNGIGDWLTQDANRGIQNLDAQYKPYSDANPISAGAGNIGGSMAATLPLALMGPAGAVGMGARLATGAGLGAANAAVTPVANDGSDYWGQKAAQMGVGAAFGGAGSTAAALLGKAVAGASGPAQKLLANAGVTMTPGQILGGALARTEEKLTSIPVLGDFIKNAQQRAVKSFNSATYNQVLAPLGEKYSGPIGNEGVAAVQSRISNAYDSALSKMTFNANDPGFQTDLGKLGQMATGLPDAQKANFLNIIRNQVTNKLSPQGVMDGETLKGVQSELGRLSRGYSGDPSMDNQQLGAAIGEVKTAIESSLPRYNAPEPVSQLQNANAAYANFVRLRTAAASQGAMNRDGIFTPAQLNSAVRSSDKSVGKGATARGQALMQEFSGSGQNVLGSKYPDSGTPGRAAIGLGLGGVAGHFLAPGIAVPAAAATAGALLPYTAAGQRVIQALLMKRPEAAGAIGKAISNVGSPVAATLGAALANSGNR